LSAWAAAGKTPNRSCAPAYRIEEEHSQSYEQGSLFHNPYGPWRLVPIAG